MLQFYTWICYFIMPQLINIINFKVILHISEKILLFMQNLLKFASAWYVQVKDSYKHALKTPSNKRWKPTSPVVFSTRVYMLYF